MAKVLSLLVAVAVLGSGGMVLAQAKQKKEHKRPSPEQVFKKLDTNHDGSLTCEEFTANPHIKDKARAEKWFKKMDTNKDGKVSCQEFEAAWKARAEHHHKGGHKKKAQ